MDTVTGSKLHVRVAAINDTATIYLNGHFSFAAHREFKAAYKNQLNNSMIGNIVVNLAEVSYMDSSALGMLLVLRDHVQAANKSLTLSTPSSIAKRTFAIASFQKIFTIN
jgi:anti-anti-sigma factor